MFCGSRLQVSRRSLKMLRHRGAVQHALLLALALLASCRAERASTDVTGDFSSDVRILSEVASGEAGSGATTVKPECAAPADAGSGDVVDDSGSGDAGSGAPAPTTLRLQLKLTQPCGALPSVADLETGLYAAVGVPAGVAAEEFAVELPFDATTDPSATLVVVVLSGAAASSRTTAAGGAEGARDACCRACRRSARRHLFGERDARAHSTWLRKLGLAARRPTSSRAGRRLPRRAAVAVSDAAAVAAARRRPRRRRRKPSSTASSTWRSCSRRPRSTTTAATTSSPCRRPRHCPRAAEDRQRRAIDIDDRCPAGAPRLIATTSSSAVRGGGGRGHRCVHDPAAAVAPPQATAGSLVTVGLQLVGVT